MTEISIAFGSTSREWQERWAAHLADHGPAEVVDVIADPRAAFDRTWRLVVIDASSILMEPGFVASVRDRGRGVIGVWDPNEPGTKQRAVDAGVDELLEAEASALEFVATLMETAVRFAGSDADDRRARRRPPVTASRPVRSGQLVAVGGPVGADPAPVVLGMALALARRKSESVLVADTDEVTPSLAQLLDLPPVPNLASAVATARAGTDPDDDLQAGDGYYVLAGLAEPGQWSEIGTRGVMSVVESFAARFNRTLVTIAPLIESLGQSARFATSRSLLAAADTIVAVGDASPVGLTRLTLWVAEVRLIAPTTALYLAAGRAPGDKFRQGQVLERLAELGRPSGAVVLPNDASRLDRAEWQGRTLRRGPLLRSVASLTDTVCPRRPKR